MKVKVALHNLGCKVNAYELEAMEQMLKNAGYEVGVYSYSYWLNNYMEISRLPADYSLWVADYGTNNNGQIPSDLDKYSETNDIWQFTDKAQIDGINGYVDMNVCYKKYF